MHDCTSVEKIMHACSCVEDMTRGYDIMHGCRCDEEVMHGSRSTGNTHGCRSVEETMHGSGCVGPGCGALAPTRAKFIRDSEGLADARARLHKAGKKRKEPEPSFAAEQPACNRPAGLYTMSQCHRFEQLRLRVRARAQRSQEPTTLSSA